MTNNTMTNNANVPAPPTPGVEEQTGAPAAGGGLFQCALCRDLVYETQLEYHMGICKEDDHVLPKVVEKVDRATSPIKGSGGAPLSAALIEEEAVGQPQPAEPLIEGADPPTAAAQAEIPLGDQDQAEYCDEDDLAFLHQAGNFLHYPESASRQSSSATGEERNNWPSSNNNNNWPSSPLPFQQQPIISSYIDEPEEDMIRGTVKKSEAVAVEGDHSHPPRRTNPSSPYNSGFRRDVLHEGVAFFCTG